MAFERILRKMADLIFDFNPHFCDPKGFFSTPLWLLRMDAKVLAGGNDYTLLVCNVNIKLLLFDFNVEQFQKKLKYKTVIYS